MNASFSSQFHTLSKLVMLALMIRGRHRGLPHAIDKAITLPDKHLEDLRPEPSRARLISSSRSDLRSERSVPRSMTA